MALSFGLVRATFEASLTSSPSVVFKQQVNNAEFITIEADTDAALSSFTLKMVGHEGSVPSVIAEASSDYVSPKGIIRGSNCDMTTLADKGWVMLDVRGIGYIILEASAATTAALTVRVGG